MTQTEQVEQLAASKYNEASEVTVWFNGPERNYGPGVITGRLYQVAYDLFQVMAWVQSDEGQPFLFTGFFKADEITHVRAARDGKPPIIWTNSNWSTAFKNEKAPPEAGLRIQSAAY